MIVIVTVAGVALAWIALLGYYYHLHAKRK
jgi:hypothetical protein